VRHASARVPASEPVWGEREALVVALADALHDGAAVPDPLWAALAARWTPEQLLEMLVVVGFYHLVSFVANGARVAREPWAPRLPG
jgi:4-carboxymuconolactone decarboxylase